MSHANRTPLPLSRTLPPHTHIPARSPISRGFDVDRLVVECKCNALQLSEEMYSWYQTRLRIQPGALTRAREFCKALLHLLIKANLTRYNDKRANITLADVKVNSNEDDPFRYAALLEKEALGLPDTAPPEYKEAWKRRVWQYLAWAVDGGLLPSVLRMDSLVYDYQTMSGNPRAQNRLSHMLETMLYFRRPGSKFRYSPLSNKIQDERLMRNFVFNEAVMIRLLETNYIKLSLCAGASATEYSRFLIRLLQRGADGGGAGGAATPSSSSLKYAVCKKLVEMSMVEDAEQKGSARAVTDDVSLNMVVPTLIKLLHDRDDNIKVLAVVALVNFTQNNNAMKNAVMAAGATRRVVQFLTSKHDDLVRHSCSLLHNCTKSQQYSQTIASFGAVPHLLDLLKAQDTPPKYRQMPILVKAAAVIGNLAQDARLREQITNAMDGKSRQSKRGGDEAIPGALNILINLLDKDTVVDLGSPKPPALMPLQVRPLVVRAMRTSQGSGAGARKECIVTAAAASLPYVYAPSPPPRLTMVSGIPCLSSPLFLIFRAYHTHTHHCFSLWS